MKRAGRFLKCATWFPVVLLITSVTGCGKDSRGQILGTGDIGALAPTVTAVSPIAGATGVPVNAVITVALSEPIAPDTTVVSVTCMSPCEGPQGKVTLDATDKIATFTPAANLAPLTSYTVTVTAANSLATGLALASPYTWSFSTGALPTTGSPMVSATSPPAGASGVAINTLITASFSESMNPLTITSASFTLACPYGSPIAGTVGYAVDGTIATFTPATALPASTVCTGNISAAVTDVADHHLASAVSWSFTTGAAPDTTPPTVSATSPLAGASGVAFNTLISASFSEAMNPLTISSTSFTLACPSGTPIAGSVGYAVNGSIATLTPAGALPASTICAAQITTAAKDAAGNSLVNNYSWSFTTGAAPDTTPPTVSATSPLAGASGVAINTLISASFSEAMNPLTISSTSFTLACPSGTPIAGSVGYAVNGSIATLTPAGALPASTICAAQITTAAKDAAGNALVNNYSWSFTTGAAPDTTPPTVTSTNPANGAVGVCINKTINVTFSEPMDPLTISTSTFKLNATAGASVTGTVTYDAQTYIATFMPGTNLTGTPATAYTATVKGGVNGVKDVAGNSLVSDLVTTFTTNASTCTSAPALGAAQPFGAFGGIATITNDGLNTVINGDIGVDAASTTVTGFHDAGGNVYTITPNNNGFVNGIIYTLTAPPGSVAGVTVTQAGADALAAFNSISPANLPGGIDISSLAQCPSCGGAGGGADELAGRTLPPGIYLSATGTYDVGGAGRTTANLTLDAGGDANAVWVFQTTSGTGTLNVGLTGPATPAVPIQVLLINGALAKNVFWYVPAGAAIGTGSTVAGTLLANASITMSTTGGSPPTAVTTTVNGRAIALTAAVTMTNTIINIPSP
jgi:hypothetical protein